MVKKFLLFILITCFFIAIVSCKQADKTNGGISIVTTVFPAYDFAKNVAGEFATIDMLIAPGSEVHTYDPTAKDMIKIADCDLFICVGGESDSWVESILSAKEYKNLNIIKMIECVDAVNEEIVDGMEAENANDEAEKDEHVWTSPLNAIKISEAIANELCKIDPDNADSYKAKFTVYTTKLNTLNYEFLQVSDKIENKTLIFADRFPMRYFTEEYGFDYYAAFPGCSSQTEPSAATIVYLIDKIKSENIPAVFCIEFSNGKLADTICEETGAKKYTLHSCHNVSKDDFNNNVSYIDLMKRNLTTLKEAFGV